MPIKGMDRQKSKRNGRSKDTWKPLKGKLSSYWQYRVGQYRILVELLDQELVIVIITIGLKRDVYK